MRSTLYCRVLVAVDSEDRGLVTHNSDQSFHYITWKLQVQVGSAVFSGFFSENTEFIHFLDILFGPRTGPHLFYTELAQVTAPSVI